MSFRCSIHLPRPWSVMAIIQLQRNQSNRYLPMLARKVNAGFPLLKLQIKHTCVHVTLGSHCSLFYADWLAELGLYDGCKCWFHCFVSHATEITGKRLIRNVRFAFKVEWDWILVVSFSLHRFGIHHNVIEERFFHATLLFEHPPRRWHEIWLLFDSCQRTTISLDQTKQHP